MPGNLPIRVDLKKCWRLDVVDDSKHVTNIFSSKVVTNVDLNPFLADRILSVSVRSEDEDKFIQSGMTLPIGVSDGKYKENFDVIVQRCTCQGPNDNTKCADYIQKPPILTAQVRSREVI